MRLNLIAEPSNCTQLPASVQCTPTYCTLEPGSNRVSVGIKNISSRAITHTIQGCCGETTTG